MDRDEEIACRKEAIKSKETALVILTSKTEALADERRAMLKLPETSRDGLLLKSFDDDISYMRKKER